MQSILPYPRVFFWTFRSLLYQIPPSLSIPFFKSRGGLSVSVLNAAAVCGMIDTELPMKGAFSMIRPIIRDPFFLMQRSEPVTGADAAKLSADLTDTLRANLGRCVGMAANMIGERKRAIIFRDGPALTVMFNPQITAAHGEYEAEEGCLSLDGTRKTKRFRSVTVRYRDVQFRSRTGVFEDFTAQIIQHEIDHCDGILI